MRVKLFQVRDVVAACMQGPIFMERTEGPAVRGFREALNDPQVLGNRAGDLELWHVADYDDSSGCLLASDISFPVCVYSGADFVTEKEAANVVEA